jgi:hypothetical protein
VLSAPPSGLYELEAAATPDGLVIAGGLDRATASGASRRVFKLSTKR